MALVQRPFRRSFFMRTSQTRLLGFTSLRLAFMRR
jgi:hypothetical protein